MTVRYAFSMKLKDDSVISLYEESHRAIGREVLAAHTRSGIRNYSIYRQGLVLFGYFEATSPEKSMAALAQEPVMADWWSKMQPLMRVEASGRPMIRELPEVFHLD